MYLAKEWPIFSTETCLTDSHVCQLPDILQSVSFISARSCRKFFFFFCGLTDTQFFVQYKWVSPCQFNHFREVFNLTSSKFGCCSAWVLVPEIKDCPKFDVSRPNGFYARDHQIFYLKWLPDQNNDIKVPITFLLLMLQ